MVGKACPRERMPTLHIGRNNGVRLLEHTQGFWHRQTEPFRGNVAIQSTTYWHGDINQRADGILVGYFAATQPVIPFFMTLTLRKPADFARSAAMCEAMHCSL
jgi:hypothetical protein